MQIIKFNVGDTVKVGFKIIGDYPYGDYAYKMQYQGGKYENN